MNKAQTLLKRIQSVNESLKKRSTKSINESEGLDKPFLNAFKNHKNDMVEIAKTKLKKFGDVVTGTNGVIYYLADNDGFLDIYDGFIDQEDMDNAMEDQLPITDEVGDLEIDVWMEAAKELKFTKVESELKRIKEEGL